MSNFPFPVSGSFILFDCASFEEVDCAQMWTLGVGLFVSFFIGALIAWFTRDRPSARLAPQLREPEILEEDAEPLLFNEPMGDNVVDSSEDTPLYAPYSVGPRLSIERAADNFLAIPESLSAPNSVPGSPRAGRVEWQPDNARDDCNFCLAKFTGLLQT
jgi:hypothetical protein